MLRYCHCCYIMMNQLNTVRRPKIAYRARIGPGKKKVLILILFKRVYRYAHAGPLRTRFTRRYEEFRIDHCSDEQQKKYTWLASAFVPNFIDVTWHTANIPCYCYILYDTLRLHTSTACGGTSPSPAAIY